jgi:acid phosphatase
MINKSVMLALNGYIIQSVALSVSSRSEATCSGSANVSLSWYPPTKYDVNNLTTVINGTGVYGFVFNSSQAPLDAYNWCNMPHTNVKTYVQPSAEYKLEYVEVIHRHHKRTPYASNTFPREQYAWSCSDEGLFYGGQPLNPTGNVSASTYWDVFTSRSNPLAVSGFNGTCMFPQITRGGLDDSHAHGADLAAVYAGLLNFIPSGDYDPSAVSYRVTNNVITSQVASMVIPGMYPSLGRGAPTPLLIQPPSVDSLEPAYSCPTGSSLFSSYSTGSQNPDWLAHLRASSALYSKLDAISGVDPSDSGWHRNWDHYFDNLSARQCHAKPLPCAASNATKCVSQTDADAVYRLGEYEYSFIYRDSPQSLQASVASYGIWMAELAAHLRSAASTASGPAHYGNSKEPRYRHNVAHDGSISRLLSILQIEKMVWPGMGSEVVFELYRKKNDGCYYLRVLWGGRNLISSHPAFGKFDMVPLSTFLAYVDGLVGSGAVKVPGLCGR